MLDEQTDRDEVAVGEIGCDSFHFGGNLDALHDCLTDIAVSATEADPVTVTFAGYKKAKRALGSDFHNFRNVLNDVSEEYPDFIVEWRRKA